MFFVIFTMLIQIYYFLNDSACNDVYGDDNDVDYGDNMMLMLVTIKMILMMMVVTVVMKII
jgi:hypothetical protein